MNDDFEAVMRYTPVSRETDLPIAGSAKQQLDQNSDEIKYMYYPRIKCLDCPGKWYTPGPETGVTNFEVHLKNKQHIKNVDDRLEREGKERRV